MPRTTIRERVGALDPEPAIEGALRQLSMGRGIIPVWSPDLTKPPNEKGEHPCMCPKGALCKSPGKHPAVYDKNDGHGFENSFLKDEQSIRTVLSNPGTRNYGVVPAPGEVFLDLDGEGLQTWRELGEVLGKAPPTNAQKTRNGYHAAYIVDDDPGGNLFDIVTRRHPGGYVVGEGSMHPTGVRYEQIGPRTVAKLPPNYVERAREARADLKAHPLTAPEVPAGKRHDFLRDQARYLHGKGLSDGAVFTTLMAMNEEFPEPKTPEEVRQAMGDLSRFPVDPPMPTIRVDHEARSVESRTSTLPKKPSTTHTDPQKRATRLSNKRVRPVNWLWRGWFVRGEISILEGWGGMSKSTVMVDLIARMTTGRTWPDLSQNEMGACDVLYITGEDDPEQVVLPRLMVAGGDPDRVHFWDTEFVMPEFLPDLEEYLSLYPEIRLVLIDPLFSHLDSDVNTGRDTEVRQIIMDPLQDLAHKYDVSMVVARHLNKQSGVGIEVKGSGSYGGLTGRARTVQMIIENPEDPNREERLFGVHKSNYGRMPRPWRFKINEATLADLPGDTFPVVSWLGEAHIFMDEAYEKSQRVARDRASRTREDKKIDALRAAFDASPHTADGWARTSDIIANCSLSERLCQSAFVDFDWQKRKVGMDGGWERKPPEDTAVSSPHESSRSSRPSEESPPTYDDHWTRKRAREAPVEELGLAEQSND